jgi:protease-4
MAADVIVAQPGTLTGSIGVITGKPVFEEAFGRLGITTDSVSVGSGATMFAPTHPFSEDEWQRINTWLDAIYRDFTAKVASGRRMTVERVDEIARGRVWTGADAARNGLVDELGGMSAAADIARRRAGLPADAPLRVFPRLTPLDLRRRVGPRLAVRGPGRPAAVRTADAPGPLDHQLTGRTGLGTPLTRHPVPPERPHRTRHETGGSGRPGAMKPRVHSVPEPPLLAPA